MANLVRRHVAARFPDVSDWLDAPWTPLVPFAPAHTFRVEEYVKDHSYVVRAELPGMDPDNDIEITVDDRTLTIHAERREEHKEQHRPEFRYGSLTRAVTLPAAVDADRITARYDKGILEVTVPTPEAAQEGRRITITKTA